MGKLYYKTLREEMLDTIRMRIVNLEIKPGEKIIETDLANEFGTSRAPIREALRQLENEGFVEYSRNVGCSAKDISTQDAYEIYLMRITYETLAVKILDGKIPESTIRNLEEILNRMKHIEVEDYLDVFVLDNEFHGELLKMVSCPRLYKQWSILNYGNIITSRRKNLDKSNVVKRQYTRHKEIFDACVSGNCEEICKTIMNHYSATVEKIARESESNQEYIHQFRIPV